MTATAEFLNDAAQPRRPEPDRDRWGRYKIPHPESGKQQSWTRATTWASSVADTFGLTKWQLRMTALGLAQRPDLLAGVASTDADDRKTLDRICEQAKEHAGASTRANLGTALHAFCEQVDLGQTPLIPAPWNAEVDAYTAAMENAGITILPEYVEGIVTVPDLEVAGTFDRVVKMPDGRLLVADLKTGRDLSYSWTEIAIQLALYAYAATVYDPTTKTHTPMPDVDGAQALVMHLPVGEATCTLHLVDIAAGWQMAQVCGTVRAWRKRKDLAVPYVSEAEQEAIDEYAGELAGAGLIIDDEGGVVEILPDTDRDDWLRCRIRTLGADPRAKALVAQHWPASVPTKPPWTGDEGEQLDAVLTTVEADTGAQFPERDPAKPIRPEPTPPAPSTVETSRRPPWPYQPDMTAATAGDVDRLRQTVGALDVARRTTLLRWVQEGRQEQRPFDATKGGMTVHAASVMNAALACIRAFWDADDEDGLTRVALAHVDGDPLDPTWRLGAVLGSLSPSRTIGVRQLAADYQAGAKCAVAAIGDAYAATLLHDTEKETNHEQ